ncbi:type IV secretion system protein, partial [Flavobacteriaceae bacterium]|nr:type IV secretion system protein [Flavobacteriaceae bacterium]
YANDKPKEGSNIVKKISTAFPVGKHPIVIKVNGAINFNSGDEIGFQTSGNLPTNEGMPVFSGKPVTLKISRLDKTTSSTFDEASYLLLSRLIGFVVEEDKKDADPSSETHISQKPYIDYSETETIDNILKDQPNPSCSKKIVESIENSESSSSNSKCMDALAKDSSAIDSEDCKEYKAATSNNLFVNNDKCYSNACDNLNVDSDLSLINKNNSDIDFIFYTNCLQAFIDNASASDHADCKNYYLMYDSDYGTDKENESIKVKFNQIYKRCAAKIKNSDGKITEIPKLKDITYNYYKYNSSSNIITFNDAIFSTQSSSPSISSDQCKNDPSECQNIQYSGYFKKNITFSKTGKLYFFIADDPNGADPNLKFNVINEGQKVFYSNGKRLKIVASRGNDECILDSAYHRFSKSGELNLKVNESKDNLGLNCEIGNINRVAESASEEARKVNFSFYFDDDDSNYSNNGGYYKISVISKNVTSAFNPLGFGQEGESFIKTILREMDGYRPKKKELTKNEIYQEYSGENIIASVNQDIDDIFKTYCGIKSDSSRYGDSFFTNNSLWEYTYDNGWYIDAKSDKCVWNATDSNGGLVQKVYKTFLDSPFYRNTINSLLVLMVIFYAITTLTGISDFSRDNVIKKMIRFGVIMLFLHPDAGFYWFSNIFIDAFKGGVNQMVYNISESFSGVPSGDITPDITLTLFESEAINIIFSKAFVGKLFALFFDIPIGTIAFLFIVFPAVILYIYTFFYVVFLYLIAQLTISLMFILAPIFLVAALFESTKEMFDNWLSQLFSLSMQQIMLIITFKFFNIIVLGILKITFHYEVCPAWYDVIFGLGFSFYKIAHLPITFGVFFKFLLFFAAVYIMNKMIFFISKLIGQIFEGFRIGKMATSAVNAMKGAIPDAIRSSASSPYETIVGKTFKRHLIDNPVVSKIDDKLFNSGSIAEERREQLNQNLENIEDKGKEIRKAFANDVRENPHKYIGKDLKVEQEKFIDGKLNDLFNKDQFSDKEKKLIKDLASGKRASASDFWNRINNKKNSSMVSSAIEKAYSSFKETDMNMKAYKELANKFTTKITGNKSDLGDSLENENINKLKGKLDEKMEELMMEINGSTNKDGTIKNSDDSKMSKVKGKLIKNADSYRKIKNNALEELNKMKENFAEAMEQEKGNNEVKENDRYKELKNRKDKIEKYTEPEQKRD